MIKQIFALYDTKAETFGQPIFAPNLAVVTRDLQDEVNRQDQKNALGNHAEDFELYQLGIYDELQGQFDTHKPKLLLKLATLKQERTNNVQ